VVAVAVAVFGGSAGVARAVARAMTVIGGGGSGGGVGSVGGR
jgi:hypothetical protein